MVRTEKGYVAQKGLVDRLKNYLCFNDEEKKEEMRLPPDTLITPITPFQKRIKMTIREFDELIDSSNISIPDWVKISKTIEQNYKKYDGFIVLHGTDTLAYTASALSFMLENLNKTVVVTGS